MIPQRDDPQPRQRGAKRPSKSLRPPKKEYRLKPRNKPGHKRV